MKIFRGFALPTLDVTEESITTTGINLANGAFGVLQAKENN